MWLSAHVTRNFELLGDLSFNEMIIWTDDGLSFLFFLSFFLIMDSGGFCLFLSKF